ncbi:biotin--[acetyl-CoA-carboxylase] ligase [Peptococcaceae bacterium 1198_IL3148]
MKERVLHILKSAQRISGEEICRQLNISRTAVWKHIKTLKQEGYQIDTQPRLGYQLLKTPDCLYPAEVKAGLETTFIGQKLFHFAQLSSTNDYAKELARDGGAEGAVVVTEAQVGGKGRLGRQWHSVAGEDVALSVLLYPNISPMETPKFSMLAAVAVAKGIEQTCGIKAAIKWPNDLLINGKKVCGILVEMGAEMDRVKYVVLGIGINVNSTPEMWSEDIKYKTTSVKEQNGQPINRVKLVQNLLAQLEALYLLCRERGFAPILEEWCKWCVSLNCQAKVETINGNFTGWVEGIDDSGSLLLRLKDGSVKTFTSGEVSLRL